MKLSAGNYQEKERDEREGMWVIYSIHNKHMYENFKVINTKEKRVCDRAIPVMSQQFTK